MDILYFASDLIDSCTISIGTNDPITISTPLSHNSSPSVDTTVSNSNDHGILSITTTPDTSSSSSSSLSTSFLPISSSDVINIERCLTDEFDYEYQNTIDVSNNSYNPTSHTFNQHSSTSTLIMNNQSSTVSVNVTSTMNLSTKSSASSSLCNVTSTNCVLQDVLADNLTSSNQIHHDHLSVTHSQLSSTTRINVHNSSEPSHVCATSAIANGVGLYSSHNTSSSNTHSYTYSIKKLDAQSVVNYIKCAHPSLVFRLRPDHILTVSSFIDESNSRTYFPINYSLKFFESYCECKIFTDQSRQTPSNVVSIQSTERLQLYIDAILNEKHHCQHTSLNDPKYDNIIATMTDLSTSRGFIWDAANRTYRAIDCQVIKCERLGSRCDSCEKLHNIIRRVISRRLNTDQVNNRTSSSSHCNLRFLTNEEMKKRLINITISDCNHSFILLAIITRLLIVMPQGSNSCPCF